MTDTQTKFYITTFRDYSKDTYEEGLNTNIRYKKAKLCPFIKPDRSLFLFGKHNRFRMVFAYVAESKVFEAIVLLAILANCIVMALGTPQPNSNDTNILNDKLEQSEIYFVIFFLAECIVKIISYGFVLHRHSYLRNGWNALDFFIVIIGSVSYLLSKFQTNTQVDVKALRAFRVLRPLRLVSKVPSLQIVLNSIILAMKPLANIAILMLFLTIVYAIVGMNLFMGKLHSTCYNNATLAIMDNPSPCRMTGSGTGYFCTGLSNLPANQNWVCMDFKSNASLRWPGPNDGITNFDNMALAMLTVFQITTKEGWTDDLYLANDALGSEWPWLYFVSLVLIVTFFVLNLILGVLSGEFSKQSSKVHERNKFKRDKRTMKENEDYIGYKDWIEKAEKLEDANKELNSDVVNQEEQNAFIEQNSPAHMKEEKLQENVYENVYDNEVNKNEEKVQENVIINVPYSNNKEEQLEETKKDEEDSNHKDLEADAKENSQDDKEKMPDKSFVSIRTRLQRLIKSQQIFILVLVVVFLNAVIMTTEHVNQPIWLTRFQDISNIIFVAFFSVELIIKMVALGPRGYFIKLFNIFDFIVVVCSILELSLYMSGVISSIGIAVLRCARLLRCFKPTTYWANLRQLVRNMLKSIKSILSLLILLGLFIIIFALLGMQLFGGRFTFPNAPRSSFDNFYLSIFTVFQILTGDDWNTVMYAGINAYGGISGVGGPLALYFVILYILGNYILLNVFLAIAVESLRGDDDDDEEDDNESTSNETTSTDLLQLEDKEAKLPTITDQLVLINGSAMLPPTIKNDIVSMSKIKNRNKRRTNPEQRVRINIEEEDVIEEKVEIDQEFGQMTYNDLYAEEGADDEDTDMDNKPPAPTLIPKAADFKKLTTKTDPIPTGSACFIFRDSNIIRIKCHEIVNHTLCKNAVLVCIIMSSMMLAAEDPVVDVSGRNTALNQFDYLFTGIFTLEILLKLIAYGVILHKNAFLRTPFNWIDLIVVVMGIVINSLPPNLNSQGMSAVKTLRVFRVLRPLRAIQRAKGLKHVLQCVIVALKTIAKIMLITFMLEFMFAVMGVIILKGTFNTCNDGTQTTRDTCNGTFITNPSDNASKWIVQPRQWVNSPLNYDNVANGMLTLFTVATFSGWTILLYKSVDATIENTAPILNNRPAIFLFYLIFIILVAFFMINIFVGMVIVTFQKEGDSEYTKYNLDKNKRECINFALKARPVARYIPNEYNKYKVWRFVRLRKFENFIIVLIILNTVCLAATYLNQPAVFSYVLQQLNVVFTVLFTIECILKIYAYDFRNYFTDGMNIFDVIVITGSYVDMAFSYIPIPEDSVRINLFRLFRVLRLIRLLVKIQTIRRLLWTFIKSFQALPYVLLLILLTFFIYSVMGMQFFGKIGLENSGSVINRNNNFQTVYNSLLVLFRVVTGEAWQQIMLSCVYDPIATCTNSTAICGTTISYVYFTSFVMLCSFLIMNLFVAVIIDNFDYLTRDSSILGSHHLEDFIETWSQYDCDGRGRIKHLDVVNLLTNIEPPLGFGKLCPQIRIFRNISRLNLPLQTDGTVLFNATLFALVRKGLKIKYSDNVNDKQYTKQYNDEFRTIIRTYWKNTNSHLLDQIIPPNVNESVTIGKFYATFIIENWYKKCMIKKFKMKQSPSASNNKTQEVKRRLNVSMENDQNQSEGVDESLTLSENVLASVKDTYEMLTEKLWSTLQNIFTIPDENDKS